MALGEAALLQEKAAITRELRASGEIYFMDARSCSITYFAILRIKDCLTSAVSLHYVFTPRINQHFEMFVNSYDNRSLSSESNVTSAQLWFYGLTSYCGESELSEVNIASFGLDYDCPRPCSDYDGETWNELSVQVPEIPCPLSDTAFNVLKTSVDPLEDSSCYGIDIYIKSVEVVNDLSSRC